MDCSTPGFPVLYYLLEFAQTLVLVLMMPSNHLILCCSLLLLPSVFPRIRVFSSELALHIKWPERWSFSFSISPSNEYSGLISFRIDQFDLLTVQGTLKSLLHNHNSKASFLEHSAFSMLSGFVIAFLPRSKGLLISWLQSLSTVIFEPKKIKCHCFHFFPIYLPWSKGPVAMILGLWSWLFSQLFPSPLSAWSRGSLVSLHFLTL